MLQLKCTLRACLLAATLLPSASAHAATYYVSTTGSNSNPGTSSQPLRTVAYTVSKMVAGDTAYVKGGVYNEGIIRFSKTGTQAAPIKLLSAPGHFPIINFIDKTLHHRIEIKPTSGINKPIGWITIEGFELRNGSEGMKIYNAHDLTIRRNWIHHNGHGVLGNGTRVLFDRNKINHNGKFTACAQGTTSACNGDHGIYFHGSKVTVTNNLFYDNLANGIQLNGTVSYDPAKQPGPDFALSQNWTISNNTFAYQVYANGIVIWGANCDNAVIENNIFYENRVKGASWQTQGITFSGTGSTGIVIKNNLAFASGSGGRAFLSSGGSYTQSGNIVNTLNPKFVNAPATLPSSPNFALASGSPAIDKGLPLSIAKVSYPGTSRPQLSAYDIGAYEYYSSSALAAPTSLQVGN